MPESQVGFAGCGDTSGGHLQHLQCGFSRHGETRAASQIKYSAEGCFAGLCQRPEVLLKECRSCVTQGSADREISCRITDQAQKPGRQCQVGETAGHHQASVVGCIIQGNYAYSRIPPEAIGQTSVSVTSQYEMPKFGF